MPKFAVLDNDVIINVILCDSKEIAENVTGKTCIEYTDEPAEPNGFYRNNIFIKAQPFPSWTLNEYTWEPPVSQPNDGKPYAWNEETISWVEIPVQEDDTPVL